MLEGIEVLYHSSIKINRNKIIYIDPFKIEKEYNDADIILITHNHYDHFSEEDINKVRKNDTIIVIPDDILTKVLKMNFATSNIVTVNQDEIDYVDSIKIETIPAYNINKSFHPKENGWLGYIIELEDKRYYFAGDTDITDENKKIKCDVAFVPVGGTYTMDYKEAAELVNEIEPKIAVPIHYGSIVGSKQDAVNFIKLLKPTIKGVELME